MAYFIRGTALTKMQAYEKAIEDFTQLIELEPTFLLTYHYRAVAYQSANNFAKAIEDYSRLLRLEAESPNALLNRGEIYFSLGEYEKALSDFEAVSQITYSDEAKQWIARTLAELQKDKSKERFSDKSFIRERAAAFLDKIRVEYGNRFTKTTDGFRFGRRVDWNFQLNRPITADLIGWLPEIMPEIARWDVIRSRDKDSVVVDTLTPIGELFYPHLVGIPIKEALWDAITISGYQTMIGEIAIGNVQKFQTLGKLLERISTKIRRGRLDDHLIMAHYSPPIGDKASRAMHNFLTLRPYSNSTEGYSVLLRQPKDFRHSSEVLRVALFKQFT
jgi:tetratricopeptide (TPR) repeat protein